MPRTTATRRCSLAVWSVGPPRPCSRGTGERQLLFASTSARRHQHPSLLAEAAASQPPPSASLPSAKEKMPYPPLSLLPLSSILRSAAIASVSSSRLLLPLSLKLMGYLARSPSRLLSPDHNPPLHWILKRTLYAQFCAGESRVEIQRTIGGLKGMGYGGVILAYAREAGLDHDAAVHQENGLKDDDRLQKDVALWKSGTLETVTLASEGDFVAVKFTGAGLTVLRHLSHNLPPPLGLETAMAEICDLAVKQNIRLLIDAEHQALQAGIDSWTLSLMRRYNQRASGKAVVYNTYQTYLKSAPQTLAAHLAAAYRGGFTLGIKLVRGAYLASDPRHLINDTKEQTDHAFDSISESLIKRSPNELLQPPTPFPLLSLILATHNRLSVHKAQALLRQIPTDLTYAQLMGMADEISCELLQSTPKKHSGTGPKTYKYLAWGTVGECMKYLSRRAEENRTALARTRESKEELFRELRRRLVRFLGSRD
ncbi:MAG: proline dehydrogenase [Geoglossum simile]|nr:MAG: proline dehydrogenase [Geoglossum simile]